MEEKLALKNLDDALKGRGARDQITNIHQIIEKAREFQRRGGERAEFKMIPP